jgi:hypothetical protein
MVTLIILLSGLEMLAFLARQVYQTKKKSGKTFTHRRVNEKLFK